MGKHGPKSQHPSGLGYTTPKGYHRYNLWDGKRGRAVMAHVVEWERHHGPIPEGFQVHHKNHDKQDNRIENLELVDAITHKRIHSGCELRDGEWWKPCHICGEFKPVTAEHWYISAAGYPLYGRCRPCHVRKVVADKQRRRALQVSGKGEQE